MAQPSSHSHNLSWSIYSFLTETPTYILCGILLVGVAFLLSGVYVFLHYIAPKPRPVLLSEKTYVTSTPNGTSAPKRLPCWYDRWLAERRLSEANRAQPPPGSEVPDEFTVPDTGEIGRAHV